MGYRAQKEEKEQKKRRIKVIAFCIGIFLLVALGVFAWFVPTDTWPYYFNQPEVEKRAEGSLRVHFLDVGQADCTLIEFPDGKTLLLDGGDVDSDEKILRYLNALKIDKLDYILLTHTDSDHCGGLSAVVKEKQVDTVILPLINGDETAGNNSFAEFAEVLSTSNVKTEVAHRYLQVESLDTRYPYNFCVLFPHYKQGESADGSAKGETNAKSTICWLDYRGTSILFCGDTNAETLEKIALEDEFGVFEEFGVFLKSTEIIKVPHHGAEDSLSAKVLDFFNVEIGVISCGKNNYYGHPDEKTVKYLYDSNVQVYRTDWQGDILLSVTKDGEREIEISKQTD